MSWMSMSLKLGAVAGVLVLAACKHEPYTEGPVGPSPVAIAKQVCEITALAEERDVLIDSIDADYPEAGGTSKEHRWTILKDKLREYRAEVEASYRFVTANCNSYNLCMENNGYNESACAGTRQAWVESQEKFNRLAMALNGKPWRRHHKPGHGHGGCYSGSNCGSFGGYSGDCCYDGD